MSSSENIWLVKSGTYLLGPYSHDSIVEQLLDRTLSTRDEVSQHLLHWLPIVDEPAFAKAVEELRLMFLAEEDDELTASKTIANFTITEDLNIKNKKNHTGRFQSIEKPEELNNKSAHNKVKEGSNPNNNEHVEPMTYSNMNPSRSGGFIWGAVIAAVCIFAYIVYNDSLKLSGDSLNATDYYEQGLASYKLRNNKEAISNFEKYLKLESSNQKAYYYLAQSYIGNDQQLEARSIINNKNYVDISEEEKSNLLGLSFLKENELMISEKYFTQALNNDATFIPALINSSVANNKLDKKNISVMRLQEALSGITQFPEVGFLYATSLLEEYGVSNNKLKLEEAQNFILKQFSDSFVMYQESQLLNSYITLLLKGKIKQPQAELIKILDNDPYEFSQMMFSSLVDTRALSWSGLVNICNKVAPALDDMSSTALLSYCRFKEKKYDLAKDVLAINIEKDPKNPLYLSLNSIYTKEIGDAKASKESLHLSILENDKLPSPLALPYIIKVSECLKLGDKQCLEVYSNKLLSVKSNSLLAQLAQAELQFINKNYNESHRIASRANIQVANYLPIKNLLNSLVAYVK